jgi:hypothetical protein
MPYFMNALLVLEGMSSTEDTNFLVAHHPLLHIAFASYWMFQWGYHDDGLDNAEFSQSDHT